MTPIGRLQAVRTRALMRRQELAATTPSNSEADEYVHHELIGTCTRLVESCDRQIALYTKAQQAEAETEQQFLERQPIGNHTAQRRQVPNLRDITGS